MKKYPSPPTPREIKFLEKIERLRTEATPRELKFLEEIERLNAYVEEWKRRYETARLAHEEGRKEIERLRDLADSMGQDNIMAQIELEQLRHDHVAMLDRCTSRCVKLQARIVTLEGMLGEANIEVPE